MDLVDKVVVVTGAARGIGKALCHRFARESPCAIVAADIDVDEARQTASEVGGNAVACDVAQEDQIQQLVKTVEQEHGRIEPVLRKCGYRVVRRCGDKRRRLEKDYGRQLDVPRLFVACSAS